MKNLTQKGMKVEIKINGEYEEQIFTENTLKQNISDYVESTLFDENDVRIIAKDIDLYTCATYQVNGDLAMLCEIRNKWSNNKYKYNSLRTKEEIKTLLKENYVVAVKGFGEVDIEDLNKI